MFLASLNCFWNFSTVISFKVMNMFYLNYNFRAAGLQGIYKFGSDLGGDCALWTVDTMEQVRSRGAVDPTSRCWLSVIIPLTSNRGMEKVLFGGFSLITCNLVNKLFLFYRHGAYLLTLLIHSYSYGVPVSVNRNLASSLAIKIIVARLISPQAYLIKSYFFSLQHRETQILKNECQDFPGNFLFQFPLYLSRGVKNIDKERFFDIGEKNPPTFRKQDLLLIGLIVLFTHLGWVYRGLATAAYINQGPLVQPLSFAFFPNSTTNKVFSLIFPRVYFIEIFTPLWKRLLPHNIGDWSGIQTHAPEEINLLLKRCWIKDLQDSKLISFCRSSRRPNYQKNSSENGPLLLWKTRKKTKSRHTNANYL